MTQAQDAIRPVRALAQPRLLAVACVAVLVAAGWAYLGLMLAGTSDAPLLAVLCRPSFGASYPDVAQAALLLAMWCAMVLAMMLPTAGPMILTYADIAETAAQKDEAVASVLVLTAGYVVVWFAAAVALAVLQVLFARLSLIDPAMASASPLFSGAIFIGAGLYQFSALKHACVTQCQQPFSFFLANWTATPRGVFGLGLRQGLYCLGCCWAMMLLMFAFGVMNVIWMAVLGIMTTIEKLNTTTRFSRALGAVFILVGAGFIVSSVAAHWPPAGGYAWRKTGG